jgi:hypothetical protein
MSIFFRSNRLFQINQSSLFLGLLLLITGCNTGSNNAGGATLDVNYLQDEWQVMSISLPEMAETSFPNRESFDAYLQTRATMQNLSSESLQMEMHFMEDGQMQTSTLGEVANSTYYLDGNSLFMIVEGTPPEKYEVLEVQPNSMVLRLLDKTINNSFIDMHLQRK